MTPTDRDPAWTTELLSAPHVASDKARRVRHMFNAIAPRYELVNTVFSGGRDASWRRRAVSLASASTHDAVLDVACGTGDFARAFHRRGVRAVVGCDFARDMLERAAAHSVSGIDWCEADALHLPFDDARFDIISCAFGVRNFQDLDRGLAEMFRVVRPGGRVVILEFTRPTTRLIRWAYEAYAGRIMPRLAEWLSGDDDGAYRYLPRSITSFLTAEQMVARLARTGFAQVRATPLTMGVVTVYVASRSSTRSNDVGLDGMK